MKPSFFTFAAVLLTGMAFAGNTDSLITLHQKAKTADERAGLAFEIALANIFSQPELAANYLFASVEEEREIKDLKKVGKCYNSLGVYYYMKSAYDSSLFHLEKAVAVFEKLDDTTDLFKARKNMGLSLTGKGDYAGAVRIYFQSLEHSKKIKDTAGIVGTLNDIGNTYQYMSNYTEAMKFQKEALVYLSKYSSPAVLGNVYNSIGYIHDAEERMDSAIFYYTKSLELKEKYGNLRSVLITKNNLCQCIDSEVKARESISCFEGLLELQKKAGDNSGIVRTYSNLSVAFRNMGKYEKAVELLKLALKKSEEINDLAFIAQSYMKLAEVHRRMGKYDLAYSYLEEYLNYKDSVFYTERNRETVEMAAKYELEKKNRELLETQKAKLEADLEIEEKNYWLLALSMLLVVGVSTGIIFLQRYRAKQEKEKAKAVLKERDKGMKAIIDAQESERIRIARELHDGVGNRLLGLQMTLKQIIGPGEEEDKLQAYRILGDVMDEVRHVSHQMMPKVLQEFGCVPALEDMLENSLSFSGIQYSFETHNINKRYDPFLETAIYRVAQELINNVIKHSGATMVSLQLIESNQTLVLFIEDNGKGMAGRDKSKDGIGITGIKSRISAINGEINILPGEESGTVVTIRIPVRFSEVVEEEAELV